MSSVSVFTGSLAAGVAPSFYRELAELTPGKIVADVRGEELLQLLDGPKKPTLVKPNREELAKTVGRYLNSDNELFAAMARGERARGGMGRCFAGKRRTLGFVGCRRIIYILAARARPCS
ncbi:MAG: hypothetical protein QM775_06765 [Pirellulales bacterium]